MLPVATHMPPEHHPRLFLIVGGKKYDYTALLVLLVVVSLLTQAVSLSMLRAWFHV